MPQKCGDFVLCFSFSYIIVWGFEKEQQILIVRIVGLRLLKHLYTRQSGESKTGKYGLDLCNKLMTCSGHNLPLTLQQLE